MLKRDLDSSNSSSTSKKKSKIDIPSCFVVISTGYESNLVTDDLLLCSVGGTYVRIGYKVAPEFEEIVNEMKNTGYVGDSEVIFSCDSLDFDVVTKFINELEEWEYCRIFRGAVNIVGKYNMTNERRFLVLTLDAEAG